MLQKKEKLAFDEDLLKIFKKSSEKALFKVRKSSDKVKKVLLLQKQDFKDNFWKSFYKISRITFEKAFDKISQLLNLF